LYTRILVPLDRSKLSEAILPVAARFAGALHAQLHLLAVIDENAALSQKGAVRLPKAQTWSPEADVRNLTEDYLNGVARGTGLPPERVRTTVMMGHAADTIIAVAEQEPGTLIAMTSHGRTGLGQFLIGSVANKILHTSTVPVFLFRSKDAQSGQLPAALKTVIVPLDGSTLAEQALPGARELAAALGLDIILVRVTEPLVGYDASMGVEYTPQDVIDTIRQEAKSYLAGKVKEIKTSGFERVTAEDLFGYPAPSIIALAQRTPGSFVAMTSHGRSGVRRWVLGSVAERVATYSGEPVLIIRAHL
jgi:nucleotide-binding universal stress UspA family protein